MSLEGCRSPSCPAAEERASSFSVGRDAIFNYWSLGLSVTGDFLLANVRIKLYGRYSSQPSLLPVQVVQNWQGTDSLACDRPGTCHFKLI